MSLIEEKSDFPRRLKLFMFGVILGSVVMYFAVFKDRNVYKSPQEVVLEKLLRFPSTANKVSSDKMELNKIKIEEIKELLKNGDVNFSESEVHKKPCPIYKIENNLEEKPLKTVFFELCDSTSTLIDVVYNK